MHESLPSLMRNAVKELGIAPLTSMYLYGEDKPRPPDDWRPEVHDSDGLLIHSSGGEWLWRPLGGVVWSVENESARIALRAAFAFGWGLVLVSTFLINHFDLFGLRQVWLQLLGKPYTSLKFGTPGPYKLVRHPLYVGWFFAFWMTPVMTFTHLLFAVMTTAYILVAIQFEERDLVRSHGEYADYRKRVPMLIPFTKRTNDSAPDAVTQT